MKNFLIFLLLLIGAHAFAQDYCVITLKNGKKYITDAEKLDSIGFSEIISVDSVENVNIKDIQQDSLISLLMKESKNHCDSIMKINGTVDSMAIATNRIESNDASQDSLINLLVEETKIHCDSLYLLNKKTDSIELLSKMVTDLEQKVSGSTDVEYDVEGGTFTSSGDTGSSYAARTTSSKKTENRPFKITVDDAYKIAKIQVTNDEGVVVLYTDTNDVLSTFTVDGTTKFGGQLVPIGHIRFGFYKKDGAKINSTEYSSIIKSFDYLDNASGLIYDVEILEKNKKAERPTSGIENFIVSVNYKNTFNEIGESVNENEDGTAMLYNDNCVVALPSAYSSTGKPTRLIIHCGGTGERINSNTNPLLSDYHGWNYYVSKGFAVLDCNGISEDYISVVRGGGSSNHFGCKYLLQSYKKAYDYVLKKYNIAQDGCFVSGISMGGLASFMIVQSGMFPVIAQAGFCPCTDIFKQSFLNPWSDQQEKTPIDFGFDEKGSSSNKEWFIRNVEKVIGWNSHIKNTFGDKSDIFNYFEGDNEENVYNGLSKLYPCPIKIWHCKDDQTVTYRYSKYLVTMIRNAGGTAELHSFDNGGHSGGWSFGSVVDGDITTSINFFEAIKFFERYNNL